MVDQAIHRSSGGILVRRGEGSWRNRNKKGAIPFDAPKIEAIKLNHRGPRCTFEAILEDYTISDPALESDDLRRHRLNGIMLVNRGRISGRPIPSNVEFCQTQHAAVPLNERLAMALGSILEG